MRLRLKLPTLADVGAVKRAVPKVAVPTRKAEKAKAGRKEKAVKVDVRAKCVARDGYCRIRDLRINGDRAELGLQTIACAGPSEWAHLDEKRRSKTRGQAPEVRHTTADSVMFCRTHHAQYDGRERPRLIVRRLTKRGADGPLSFEEEMPTYYAAALSRI